MTIKEVAQRYHLTQDTLRYYERVKMIPEVHRTSSGIRDYQEEDLRWLELALCMRKAGLPVEAMIEYLRLYQEGDETIPARLELLKNQMELLKKQKEQLEATMSHLSYKISRYEEAMKTGTLSWDDDRKCPLADVIGVTESGKSPSTASIANIRFLI
ncbi:MAG: MerR family transcriptional regulator [Lachnospiraceae bacterium]|nr:MerR family transcriptional regulator [Lachnospiraceae bacterium]